MTSSNRLFGNISTIYIATAQSPIFWLLRIIRSFRYCASLKYLSPANQQIISTLEIVYLFGYCAQKNCTTSNCYLETFRRFIWLLRKAQFLGYCASPNYLCTANRQIISRLEIVYIIVYCAQTNFVATSNRLFGNISTNYMATTQSTIFGYCASIILLMHIS